MSLLKIAPEKMQSTLLSEDWKVRVRKSKEGLCKVHVTKPQILPNTQLYNREEKKRAVGGGGSGTISSSQHGDSLLPNPKKRAPGCRTLHTRHRSAAFFPPRPNASPQPSKPSPLVMCSLLLEQSRKSCSLPPRPS